MRVVQTTQSIYSSMEQTLSRINYHERDASHTLCQTHSKRLHSFSLFLPTSIISH